ncbi:MAG: hypothetical protein ACP5JB_07080 [candidate division WOR-3 bacterium]|jgi:hypothetical protein
MTWLFISLQIALTGSFLNNRSETIGCIRRIEIKDTYSDYYLKPAERSN